MYPYGSSYQQNPFWSGYYQSYNPYGTRSPMPYGGSFTPYWQQPRPQGYGYGYGGGMPSYFGRMGGNMGRYQNYQNYYDYE